jgi:hypothetical protein
MLLRVLFTSLLALVSLQLGTSAHPNLTDFTKIANVTVSNTALVQAARELARAHLTEVVYNHVMRSWLLAATLQANNPSLFSAVDPETLAIATILHDLGLDNSTFVSTDKRFEVDGAIAATRWVTAQQNRGSTKGWDENRLQMAWDAIAFHAEPSFAMYKQPLVALTSLGTACDFGGPNSDGTKTLTWEQYNAIVKAYPRGDLKGGLVNNIVTLCRKKPQTTYGIFPNPVFDHLVC